MQKYILISTFTMFSLLSCNNKNNISNTADPSNATNIDVESISDDASMYLLVGTYTAGESKGIYVYQFDTVSGNSNPKSMVEVVNPSYLAVSKNEKFVYAVTETGDKTAAANAFSFDKKEGKLKLLNSKISGGADPCYIAVDNENKHVVMANYTGGSISVIGVNNDGSLNNASGLISFMGKGVDAERQKSAHLHCVKYSPDQKYLLACDLGTDKIHKFDINTENTEEHLKSGTPPFFKVKDASGPRHLEFHPNGKYAYLINELSGAVIGFNYDSSTGNLTEFQTIQADTLQAKGSADIHVSPDGKFLYASNRLKGDGLAIFSIDQATGQLTKVGYQATGVHPRNFAMTPNGKYLLVASRDNNVIQVFQRDQNTGLLEDTFKDIQLDMPVCLKFVSFK